MMGNEIMHGVARIGSSHSQVIQVEVRFPRPFHTLPTVVATARQDPNWEPGITDTFAVTITEIMPFGFMANVFRLDEPHGWDQDLHLAWFAAGE